MSDVIDLLTNNYTLGNIEHLIANTDGANEVYIIEMANKSKLVGKSYTHDEVPSSKALSTMELLYSGNSQIPQFIKNNAGNIISKANNNTSFILSTFIEGSMIGDNHVDLEFCKSIATLLMPLHAFDSSDFTLEPWHIKASTEISFEFDIKTDLSKCTQSLIHGDLNHMNILTVNNKLSGIIDWDGIHKDYLITDLAIFAAHNLVKPETPTLKTEFIEYCQGNMRLTTHDVELYNEFITLRVKQIINLLQQRVADYPAESEMLNRYINMWTRKLM